MTTTPPSPRSITVVVTGAGPAAHVRTLIELAQARTWSVDVIATPSALAFVDADELERLTGAPIRSEYRQPSEHRERTVATASAVIVAPATYNTICKLALGISDTYALGVLAEAVGASTPVVMLPFVNAALARRAPFSRAVQSLRAEGVQVLLGPSGWTPHPPGTGGQLIESFPWAAALDAAESSAIA